MNTVMALRRARGGPEQQVYEPVLVPAAGEVLVAVHAAPIARSAAYRSCC
jgi:hypothetical protein